MPTKAQNWMLTEQGCKVWNPSPKDGETVAWSGECRNGYASGYGVEQWFKFGVAGNKLVGTMQEGKFENGKYIEIYRANDTDYLAKTYFGMFSDSRREGYGVEFFANGDTYQGQFSDNKRTGRGLYTYANGSRKEGIWKNGEFQYSEKIILAELIPKYLKEKNSLDINVLRNKLSSEPRLSDITNSPSQDTKLVENRTRDDIVREKQQLADERRKLEEERRQQQANNSNISTDKKQSQVNDTRRRLALVIGNAQYKNSPLRNPINDARDISDALTASGFAVSRYENLNYSKMREVVRDFGERLNRGDVGLFYFSGHAVQYRGKNYLLPINEDLKHSDEIPSSSLDVDFVLAKMESAKNDLNIVILDACRNNPIGAESRSLERGLTNISAAKGTFIAFATSPGNVALDGDGKNSPYTKNLTHVIRKGGMTIEQVFKEVRRNVISETNSQQVPWENSSILGDFYFR